MMADISNASTALIIGGITFLIVYFLRQTIQQRSRLPPGPRPWPVVGNLPFVGRDPREPLLQLGKIYGDVFTVYFGSRPVVVLNSYSAIKEALVKYGQQFSHRPQDNLLVEQITGGMGIISTNGEVWQEQRRFAHGVLREFGMGKSFLEDSILEELTSFISCLHHQVGKPLCFAQFTQKAVANVVCSIVFGKRYDYDDENFKQYLDAISENIKVIGGAEVLTAFPFLRYIPGDHFGYKGFIERIKFVKKFLVAHISDHHQTYDPSITRDFIDAYITEMKKYKAKGMEKSTFHDDQLEMVIGDLFGAGTETTLTTLSWGIIFLLYNPHIQEMVKAEILDVIGPDRQPRMTDKMKLPYTEATILEMQRLGDIVPLGVPRMTASDVEFRGHVIPRGTTVFPHLYAVHKDPKVWKDPYKFDPTRFLGSDGKVENKEFLIPFSMGRRVCLGESMARMELFLFFTSLIQNFTFTPVPDQPLPSLKGTLGATYSPDHFDVMLVSNV